MSVQTELFVEGPSRAKAAARLEEVVRSGFDAGKFGASFEVLCEAAGGVARLRGFILDLACRGRLVPQVEGDGTADELLANLHAGVRARDVPQGALRFRLPETWRWTTVGAVCSYIQRGKSPKYVEQSFVPVVSQKCVQWEGFLIERARFIDPESLASYGEERLLRDGDLLWNSTGHGTVGRVAVFRADPRFDKVVADSHVTVVRPLIEPRYLWCWLASPTVQVTIDDLVSGTTKQTELATSTVVSHPLPLPPLVEQKRIVAKVDQLMALCDELEARQTKKREAGTRLTKSALEALTAAESPKEFDSAWKRVVENFPLLFATASSVDDLRQALLWLGMHGVLVDQHESDGDAYALLQKIRAGRARRWEVATLRELSAAGRRPKDDAWKAKYKAARTGDASDPLVAVIPSHWSVASLEEVADVIDPNPSHRYPTYANGVVPLLSTREFRGRDGWDASGADVPLVPLSVHEDQDRRCRFSPGDIIMARKGRLGLARHAPPLTAYVFSHTVFVIKAVEEIDADFLLWFLRLDRVVAWLKREMNDNTGVPTLGKATTERLPIPLPPLSEQRRIVARVEQLMKVCDELEARLREAEDRAAKLVEAATEELVG